MDNNNIAEISDQFTIVVVQYQSYLLVSVRKRAKKTFFPLLFGTGIPPIAVCSSKYIRYLESVSNDLYGKVKNAQQMFSVLIRWTRM